MEIFQVIWKRKHMATEHIHQEDILHVRTYTDEYIYAMY